MKTPINTKEEFDKLFPYIAQEMKEYEDFMAHYTKKYVEQTPFIVGEKYDLGYFIGRHNMQGDSVFLFGASGMKDTCVNVVSHKDERSIERMLADYDERQDLKRPRGYY